MLFEVRRCCKLGSMCIARSKVVMFQIYFSAETRRRHGMPRIIIPKMVPPQVQLTQNNFATTTSRHHPTTFLSTNHIHLSKNGTLSPTQRWSHADQDRKKRIVMLTVSNSPQERSRQPSFGERARRTSTSSLRSPSRSSFLYAHRRSLVVTLPSLQRCMSMDFLFSKVAYAWKSERTP
jgi:hypothetical protein